MTDGFQYSLEVLQHVAVPEPNDAVAVVCDLRGTPVVGLRPLGVLATIEFDHQFARGTGEVGYTAADRVLPAEFPDSDPLAQSSP
jgi:hypothetical protein